MVPEPETAFPGDLEGAEAPSFQAAMRGLINREYLASDNYRKQQWRAVRLGAHPDLLEFERVMVRKMAKLGVPMFVPEMVRTAKRQDDLFALGNSRAKGGQSAHQYGLALDLVHSTLAWGLTPRQWELVHHVGEELVTQKGLKVENFCAQGRNGFDPAHWQVRDWKSQIGGYPWSIKSN